MTNKELQIIEKYIDGELGPEEKREFDKMLLSGTFAEEVRLQKEMIAYTAANQRAERKSRMLEDFRSIRKEEAKVVPLWSKLRILVAASVLIVISVFIFLNYSDEPGQELFADYYQAYDGVVITRSEGNQTLEGLSAYYEGDYRQALTQFEAVQNTEVITENQRLLLIANCYLNLGQAEESIAILQKISSPENQLITDNRDWYLAMSHLKAGNKEKTETLLNDLKNRNSGYAARAKKLLDEEFFQ